MYVLACIAPSRAANPGSRVLVVDDNVVSCNVVVAILADAGYQTDTCATSHEALELLARGHHRVLVADHHGSSLDDLSLARQVQAAHPDVSMILLTGDKSVQAAVESLQAGVFDFMTKSFDLSTLATHLLDAVHRAFEEGIPGSSVRLASAPRDALRDVLVGECPGIEQARKDLRLAIHHDTPVVVVGEPGTEKLAVARLLHASSSRHRGPFEVVSPLRGGAADELAGAVRTWSEARHGTLFFPDVATLDACQVELVKLLSGLGADPEAPRPRVIAGLCHPHDASWDGSVLMRLFQRMGCTEVRLPPLRERERDIITLAEHFAEQGRLCRGDASLRITPTALEALRRYKWPGNVDELRHAIQHATSLSVDSVIRVVDLPPSIGLSLKGASDEGGPRLAVQSLEDMELAYILRVLDAVGGNKASAARLLGVDRTTLYRKLQRQEQTELVPLSEPPPARRARR